MRIINSLRMVNCERKRSADNLIPFISYPLPCIFLVILICFASADILAQKIDSFQHLNSSSYHSDSSEIFDDSSHVVVRHFDETRLKELQNDEQLKYSTDRASTSVWQQLWWWLLELIDALFSETASTDVGRFLLYILAVIILVFVIIRVLKIDSVKLFFSGEKTSSVSHTVLEENIHEMNFEALMEDALRRKDFRIAIRLTFLQALKMLSDHHLVYWEPGKTNRDYLNELNSIELKKGFHTINYYFEYAWYGNFTVDNKLYDRVKEAFIDWRSKIR